MSIFSNGRLSAPAAKAGTAVRLLAVVMMVSFVAACASTAKQDTGIKQRAQARWDAVLSGDYDAAYSFYSPGYRSSTSRVDFEIGMRVRRVRWTTAEVLESSCTADACTLTTKMGYTVARPVPGLSEWKNSSEITERWIRTDGEWWYVPEE